MAKSSGGTRSSSSNSPKGLSSRNPIDAQIAELNSANERLFREMEADEDNREYYEDRIAENDSMIDELEGQRQAERAMEADIREIQSKGFTNMGGGMYELNTRNADAAILQDEDSMGNTIYEIQTVGAMGKNGVYTSDSPGRRFGSLNAAKAAAREELEKYYRKING